MRWCLELLVTPFIEFYISVNESDIRRALGPPQSLVAPWWAGYGCLGCEVHAVPPSVGVGG